LNEIPPEVRRFVDLIGEHATLLLIERHGGTRITVPAGTKTQLALEIGDAASSALFGELGHERIKVPLAKPWRARIYRSRGMSYSAIARKLCCNESSVWGWLHQSAASQQLSLPLIGRP
jgi:hypothetical protein